MEELKKEPIDLLVEEWLEKKVSKGIFEFSCGGDSMNDTTLTIYDEKDNIIDLSGNSQGELINQIYEEVEFYEDSDGHYQGEFGEVIIEFDVDEDTFTFEKVATSEYSESFSDKIEIEADQEIIDFCKEYIIEIKGEADYLTIEYKKDFYINEEKSNIIQQIKELIEETINDHEPEDTTAGELEDYITMSGFTINNKNKIQFDYEYRKTVYNSGE